MTSSDEVGVESGLDMDSQIITTWHPDLKDGASVTLANGQTDPQAGQSASGTGDEASDDAALADDTPPADGAPAAALLMKRPQMKYPLIRNPAMSRRTARPLPQTAPTRRVRRANTG